MRKIIDFIWQYTKHTTDMPSHQLLKNDSVLTLNSLSTQESGLLTCTAQNEFGEAHVSISVIVRSRKFIFQFFYNYLEIDQICNANISKLTENKT